MAHGRASGSSGDWQALRASGKNCSRLPSPSLLPGSRHWGKKGGWMQGPENGISPIPMRRGLATSPSPDSSRNQGSLCPRISGPRISVPETVLQSNDNEMKGVCVCIGWRCLSVDSVVKYPIQEGYPRPRVIGKNQGRRRVS